MLNRADFARKTLYGAGIISHILKEQYPGDEVVMHVKGRDCGICRNPFDDGKPSLKVWIEKLHPEQKLSDELCYYQDLSGHIPDGDAFDFAERFYGKKDQDLLEHLNKVMYLHIGEQFRQYDKPQPEPEAPVEVQQPMFTFFKRPVTNTIPCKDITLKEAYDYIISPAAKAQTEKLRTIADKKDARKYKKYNFDYVSFSGTFSYRDDDHVTKPSNLLCVDFDHLPNVEEMFQKLLHTATSPPNFCSAAPVAMASNGSFLLNIAGTRTSRYSMLSIITSAPHTAPRWTAPAAICPGPATCRTIPAHTSTPNTCNAYEGRV